MFDEQNKLKTWSKIVVWSLAILATASILIVALVRDRLVNPNQWTVSVIGRGKVLIKPDLATVNLGVTTFKAPSAKEALAQNSAKITKIVAKIKALGIADEDIQTSTYSLSPNYEYIKEQSKVTGYTANQQLTIKIRKLEAVGQIIEAAADEGANQVGDVNYSVENIDLVKDQARVLAINEARQKSQVLARAAGIRLGKVVGFWENYIAGPDVSSSAMAYGKGGEGMGGAAMIASTSVVPSGQLEVIVEMNLTYKIK